MYDGFPERVNKRLSERKEASKEISAEDQLKNEKEAEISFLKENGVDEERMPNMLPTTQDPVTAGVPKPNGVLRASQL